jgi:rod shape-determining protein MreC
MESFFSRYKNALVLIAVLLAQVIGVAIQVRRPLPKEHAQPDAGGVRLIRYWAISLVSPPERLVHWLGSSILGVWDNYLDLIHVRQQNKDLQSELQRLRIEEGGIIEDARQGQRLQQLLAFKEKYVYQTTPAQVIGTSGTEQSRILSINKGSKDGVGVDMPVITPDGIVGRIREVFPHTSQVLEITDPTSGAGVILATTRIRGILRGNAVGQPQVVNVMPDERIKAGEPVITSGGDQIFPRGLSVGVVDRVSTDPDHDPLVDVVIRPAANLAQLEEVLVITNMGDVVTPKQKLDMIQSEAAADSEQLRASEILAERLPSRVDPDSPKTDDENSDDSADAEGEGIARPMRPPSALHPDRFTPSTTPTAASLTPGARLAPQSEGTGSTTASTPKPHAASPASAPDNGDATETAVAAPKKKPEMVPDDGSRPPASMTARPASASTTTSTHAAATSADRAPTATMPATSSHATTTAGGGTVTPPEAGANGSSTSANGPAVHSAAGNRAAPGAATHSTTTAGGSTTTPTKPAGSSTTHTAIGTGTSPTGTAAVHAATPRPAASSGDGATPEVKTKVIVDGPLPSAAKKSATTTPASTTNSGQQAPAAQKQQAPGTQPAQRKSPELVPDDGSRPPPTMLQKPKPQPQQATPAQTQPQGGRQ